MNNKELLGTALKQTVVTYKAVITQSNLKTKD